MGVEQDGRPGAGEVGEQRRRLAGHLDRGHLAARVAQQLGDQRRRLVERLARESGERDRRESRRAARDRTGFAPHRSLASRAHYDPWRSPSASCAPRSWSGSTRGHCSSSAATAGCSTGRGRASPSSRYARSCSSTRDLIYQGLLDALGTRAPRRRKHRDDFSVPSHLDGFGPGSARFRFQLEPLDAQCTRLTVSLLPMAGTGPSVPPDTPARVQQLDRLAGWLAEHGDGRVLETGWGKP